MSKKRIISLLSLICYILFFTTGLLIMLGMISLFQNNDASGIGGAALALVSVIVAAAGFLYTSVSIPPIIFRFISLAKNSLIFPILCIPFDLIYIILNTAILSSALESPEALRIGVVAALLIVSVLSLLLNILSISFRKS